MQGLSSQETNNPQPEAFERFLSNRLFTLDSITSNLIVVAHTIAVRSIVDPQLYLFYSPCYALYRAIRIRNGYELQ